MITVWNIKNKILEYYEDTHTYIYNGVIIPSITEILKTKFNNKYTNVSTSVLNKAAIKGTVLHNAIERYEKEKIEIDLKELRNYKFLKKTYGFECIDNEVPVVLFIDNNPVCAGRLDLVIKEKNILCLADIKRTSVLDKEYLGYQLNLYRIAYQQCYEKEIKGLKGIHLREDTRKYINIPINEELPLELVKKYIKENEK